ncbi:MAG: hypothetical protein P1U34_08910 [Coxiellaceae bacterium]|nr:hypothetical protein [Coxiellaceae bacterium]
MSRHEHSGLTFKRNELKLLIDELTQDLLSPSSKYGLNPSTQIMIRSIISEHQPPVETIDAYRQAIDGIVADIKQAVPMYFQSHSISFFEQGRIFPMPHSVDAAAPYETKTDTPRGQLT